MRHFPEMMRELGGGGGNTRVGGGGPTLEFKCIDCCQPEEGLLWLHLLYSSNI